MENTGAAKSGGGNKLIIIVGILVLLCAGAFGGMKYYEGKLAAVYIERLNDFNPYLVVKTEKVDVSLLSCTVTVKNMDMAFQIAKDEPPLLTAKVAEVVYKGMSWDFFQNDLVAGSKIESITMRDMETMAQGSSSKVKEIVYKDITNTAPGKTKDFYFKVRDMLLKGELPEEKVIVDTIAEGYYILKAVGIGGSSTSDYTSNFGEGLISGSLHMESSESGPWTIMGGGPSVMRKATVTVMGKQAATISEMGLKSFKLGDLSPLIEIFRGPKTDKREIQTKVIEFIAKNQFALDEFYFKNIDINPAALGVKEGVKIDLLNSTFKLGPDSEYSIDLKNLYVSRELLEMATMLSPEAETLLSAFEGPLQVDKSFKAIYKQAEKLLSVKAAANLKDIGSFNGGIDLTGPDFLQTSTRKIENSIEDAKLSNMNLEITDITLSDLVFAIMAESEGGDPEELRAEAIDTLKQQIGAEKDPFLVKLLDGALKMLQDRGTLKLAFKPATPLSVDDLHKIDGKTVSAEQALGGTVEYLPPAKAPAQK